ncbi:hypothetical protein LMG33818_002397 [Halomonadaceae bacterium LMG 33818]|uniref:hypothetical protein n=1 Tax=Cernens ardua TaxID=3402176 RepID=UPI003EDC29E1
MNWVTSSNIISLFSFTVSVGNVLISYRQSKCQNEQASHAFLSSFLEKEAIEINELLDEAKALLENNRQSNKLAWKKYSEAYQKVLQAIYKNGKSQIKKTSSWLFHYLSEHSQTELMTGYGSYVMYNTDIEGWKAVYGRIENITKESRAAYYAKFNKELRHPQQKIRELFITAE